MFNFAKNCAAYISAMPVLRPVTRVLDDRRGVTALEYGLLAALIAVVVIGGATTVGADISALFTRIGGKLTPLVP